MPYQLESSYIGPDQARLRRRVLEPKVYDDWDEITELAHGLNQSGEDYFYRVVEAPASASDCPAPTHLEIIALRNGDRLIRPADNLGTCGFHPRAWQVAYVQHAQPPIAAFLSANPNWSREMIGGVS